MDLETNQIDGTSIPLLVLQWAAVEGFVDLPPPLTSPNDRVSLGSSWSLHGDTQPPLAASHRACLVGSTAARSTGEWASAISSLTSYELCFLSLLLCFPQNKTMITAQLLRA